MTTARLAQEAEAFPPLGPCEGAGAFIGAHLVLRDQTGRYLCQLRDEAPPGGDAAWCHPGRWGCFGGAVEPAETLRRGATRELAEETGIDLDPAALTPLGRIVLHTSPRRPLLCFFGARLRARPADLRLTEGAGFAFLSPAQARAFAMIPEHLLALELHASRG